MAQFEISRDGGGEEVEAAKRVWRARFSLDVEPAGPVHALVSLTGDSTSVRMWAERPATAAQLRAGAAQLSQALSRAELQPGDIVIRDGAPPQAAPPPRRAFPGSRAMSVDDQEPARGRAALRQDRRAAGRRQGQGRRSAQRSSNSPRPTTSRSRRTRCWPARSSHVELGDEIPAELYKAVAEVLIFVLRLSGRIR